MSERTFVVRMIREKRWVDEDGRFEDGDAPADGLTDLKTNSNDLSVYLVREQDLDVLSRRIAVAMAATKQNLEPTEWTWLDRASVEGLGVTLTKSPGTTPDEEMNDHHWDITSLSAANLAQLASLVHRAVRNAETNKLRMASLRADLVTAIRDGRISRTRLHKKMQDLLAADLSD